MKIKRKEQLSENDEASVEIVETIKLSDINAKADYDFQLLTIENDKLLPLNIVVEEETIVCTYNKGNCLSCTGIKEEDLDTRLLILMDISKLHSLINRYSFNLSPDNVFYGVDCQIRIKQRDIQKSSTEEYNTEFLSQYKALIGFALQNKFTYENYINGGQSLLTKDSFLKKVAVAETVDQIVKLLSDRYEELRSQEKENFKLVNKTKMTAIQIAAWFFGVVAVVACGLIAYMFLYLIPRKNASVMMYEAYQASNYPGVISSMSSVGINDMDNTEKYILAVSYIRVENLTVEQKNNIISTLTINDSGKRLEYWIYIGRNDTDSASDIAMQLSDDQLLLYSYMKARDLTETDTTLSGEEKKAKLDSIQSQMQPIIDKYYTDGNG